MTSHAGESRAVLVLAQKLPHPGEPSVLGQCSPPTLLRTASWAQSMVSRPATLQLYHKPASPGAQLSRRRKPHTAFPTHSGWGQPQHLRPHWESEGQEQWPPPRLKPSRLSWLLQGGLRLCQGAWWPSGWRAAVGRGSGGVSCSPPCSWTGLSPSVQGSVAAHHPGPEYGSAELRPPQGEAASPAARSQVWGLLAWALSVSLASFLPQLTSPAGRGPIHPSFHLGWGLARGPVWAV